MADITAKMVKELRDKTGAGMMDAKKALTETDGNVDAAIDWLRTKGLAKAAKKADRAAAEGLVAVAVTPKGAGETGVVVEVNSETDFVARNETFQKMVHEIAGLAATVDGDLEALKAAEFPGAGKSVAEHVAEMVGTIGENMTLRRAGGVAVEEGVVAAYVHNVVTDGAGKIAVLVGLKSAGNKDVLRDAARKIAMHAAAARPLAARIDELDPAVVQREKDVLSEQARESGKPENIIEKMVEGRLRKFYEESVLLEQIFVMDNETPIKGVIENAGKEAGAPAELAGFLRLELGEGVEKEESDFAAEVAAAVKG
ncbi:MAG: translation elongation factor Ts [Pseudomonadota bacterium]